MTDKIELLRKVAAMVGVSLDDDVARREMSDVMSARPTDNPASHGGPSARLAYRTRPAAPRSATPRND
jgi:hypothetical protein